MSLTQANESIPLSSMSNINPMLDDSGKVVTSHAAKTADDNIRAVANSKTAVYVFDQGVQITAGTPQTGDTIIWHDTATTSSGSVVFYVTSDRTSTGTAICSSLRNGTVDAAIIDSTGATARGDSVITSNKTITVPITKQSFAGVTLLGINVLGSSTMPAAPNGVTVRLYVVGTV